MYDIAIVGAGPAGLTAAIYARRYNMSTVVFGDVVGGLMTENPCIENFPGFKRVNGAELGEKMKEHAEGLGAEVKLEKVASIEKKDGMFVLRTEWGTEVEARTVVLAHGLKRRKLAAKNVEKFEGRGVSYCATCDGAFFKGKTVAVVGGGDSAGVAALILAEFATKVYIIYRRGEFVKMQSPYVEKIMASEKIEPVFNEEVVEALGSEKLEAVRLKSGRELPLDGLFIEIGFEPEIPFETGFKLELDRGYIKVGPDQSTSEPGVFAAGDITTGSNRFHQIATAVGEGAVAADSAYRFILHH